MSDACYILFCHDNDNALVKLGQAFALREILHIETAVAKFFSRNSEFLPSTKSNKLNSHFSNS